MEADYSRCLAETGVCAAAFCFLFFREGVGYFVGDKERQMGEETGARAGLT